MRAIRVRRRLLTAVIGVAVLLGGCSHGYHRDDADTRTDEEINVYPANYKSDILAAMHVFLNDPTGIRDAGTSEPAVKSVGGTKRYVVCVRFNGKAVGNTYGGVKEIAAVFVAGRFDRFIETAREQCAGSSYTPFPALEKLTR